MSPGWQRPVESPTGQTQLRLALTVSVALLLHVLAFALFALRPETPEHETTVKLQLVNQGTASLSTDQTTPSNELQSVANPSQPPLPPAPSELHTEATPVSPITTEISDRRVVPPRDTGVPNEMAAVVEDEPAHEAQRPSNGETLPDSPNPPERLPETADVTPRPSVERSSPGRPGPPSETAEPDTVAQHATQPEVPETDPYIIALSRHMFQPLKRILRRGPTLTRWNEAIETGTQKITIELRLLSNGAVRRVRLMESSGNEVVDQVAVQSALAASPYPPPPEKERKNGFRFKLDLLMAPVYL